MRAATVVSMAFMVSENSVSYSFFRSEHLRVQGVEVLSYRISLPFFEGEKMSGFYREIGEQVGVFCREILFPFAQKEYEESTEPRKRFRHVPYFYTLDGKITGETGSLLSVLMEARWGRKGERELLGRALDAHTWELETRMLLPPRQVAERLSLPRLRRGELRSCRGILLSGDVCLFCDGQELRPISPLDKS